MRFWLYSLCNQCMAIPEMNSAIVLYYTDSQLVYCRYWIFLNWVCFQEQDYRSSLSTFLVSLMKFFRWAMKCFTLLSKSASDFYLWIHLFQVSRNLDLRRNKSMIAYHSLFTDVLTSRILDPSRLTGGHLSYGRLLCGKKEGGRGNGALFDQRREF